jgi:hypothetical protein
MDRDVWEAMSPLLLTQETAPLVSRLQQVNFTELAQVILMWAQRLDPSVNRRVLLTKLGSAFTLAAISPLLDVLNPDEHEPVVRFWQQPDTFDLPALTYIERVISPTCVSRVTSLVPAHSAQHRRASAAGTAVN